VEGFMGMMDIIWNYIRIRFFDQRYSLDIWLGCLSMSRQYLRGWNANKRNDEKKRKKELLCRLNHLEQVAEDRALDEM
jgi:hypothetical protein